MNAGAASKASRRDEREANPGLVPKDGVAELAQLIAGDGRPVEGWLLSGLSKAAQGISWTAHKAETHPGREDVRSRMKAALDAARFLQEQISDSTFQQIMAAEVGDDLDVDARLHQGLSDFAERVDTVLNRIPTGSSRHKYEPGTNSPHAACAMAVCVAWRHARGTLPGHTSSDPQEACDRLWRLAGLSAKGWSDKPTGWRVHLREAKEQLERENRPEIERLFTPTY